MPQSIENASFLQTVLSIGVKLDSPVIKLLKQGRHVNVSAAKTPSSIAAFKVTFSAYKDAYSGDAESPMSLKIFIPNPSGVKTFSNPEHSYGLVVERTCPSAQYSNRASADPKRYTHKSE